MVSYNLLIEPWIPVRGQDGKISEKGILETLEYAHELEEICDPAPPVQFGIYRLLIAFLMDAYQLQSLADLEDLLEKGKFDKEVLEKYANQWHDRFDLFDEKHPFMQVPLDDLKKAKKPISGLMQHIPAGVNVSHFHHGRCENNAYSFAQCARGLVTVPPFTTVGGQGLSPSINGNPPWYVLVRGGNLFQTIALNMCVIPLPVKTNNTNPPVWRDDHFMEKTHHTGFSIVEGLTWMPRSIHMVPEQGGVCTYTGKKSSGLVRRMYFEPGLKAPEPGLWRDPHVAYAIGPKGVRAIKPRKNVEMWRDIGPLMLLHEEDYTSARGERYQRPAVVDQYLKITENRPLVIDVYGICTEGGKMKFYEWYSERLELPYALVYRKNAGRQIQEAVDYSTITADAVKQALKTTCQTRGSDILARAQINFWEITKLEFENWFLKRLSEEDETNPDAPHQLSIEWRKNLEGIGKRALSGVIERPDPSANELVWQVRAEDEYQQIISKNLYSKYRKRKTGEVPRND